MTARRGEGVALRHRQSQTSSETMPRSPFAELPWRFAPSRWAKFRYTTRHDADALSEPGCSRDQKQPCRDDDGPGGSRHALTGRCETLDGDGCRYDSHRALKPPRRPGFLQPLSYSSWRRHQIPSRCARLARPQFDNRPCEFQSFGQYGPEFRDFTGQQFEVSEFDGELTIETTCCHLS